MGLPIFQSPSSQELTSLGDSQGTQTSQKAAQSSLDVQRGTHHYSFDLQTHTENMQILDAIMADLRPAGGNVTRTSTQRQGGLGTNGEEARDNEEGREPEVDVEGIASSDDEYIDFNEDTVSGEEEEEEESVVSGAQGEDASLPSARSPERGRRLARLRWLVRQVELLDLAIQDMLVIIGSTNHGNIS